MKQEDNLILIPKIENYIEYVLKMLVKLPRTEKFNIGSEYKNSIYTLLKSAIYIYKIGNKLYYCNIMDAELIMQRIYVRIMFNNHWIDEKKYKVCMEHIHEIGKLVGGLIKYYAKNNQK